MVILTIGKRLIPVERKVLVEPYDPAANPRIGTERQFRAYGRSLCGGVLLSQAASGSQRDQSGGSVPGSGALAR
jgi:hypothetical protein